MWSLAGSVGVSLLLVSCSYPPLPPIEDTDPDGRPHDGPMFLSCQSLPGTCGGGGGEDCCTSILVEGGDYFRSYDQAGDAASGTRSAPATVSSFRLDKYEVTVGRFRAFVMAGKGLPSSPPEIGAGSRAAVPSSGWRLEWNQELPADRAALLASLKCYGSDLTWTDEPGANELLPVGCVSWHMAMAFCIWDGGYLPTEAELNYAAAGGGEQRAFPWSIPAGSLLVDDTRAVFGETSLLMPVGSKPQGHGRWGHADLAGNMLEWTLDWSVGDYQVPCRDCAAVAEGTTRISRGGGRGENAGYQRTSLRRTIRADSRNTNHGVRCARPAY